MRNRINIIFAFATIVLVLICMSSCGKGSSSVIVSDSGNSTEQLPSAPESTQPESSETISSSLGSESESYTVDHTILRQIADQIVFGFSEEAEDNFVTLSAAIHPLKGVRFSQYNHVSYLTDMVYKNTQIKGVLTNNKDKVNWGTDPVSKEPFFLTGTDYFNRFLHHQSFAEATVSLNKSTLSKANKIKGDYDQLYAELNYVEYHFKNIDPSGNSPSNWSALRLIFESYNDTLYLVGIVSGQPEPQPVTQPST